MSPLTSTDALAGDAAGAGGPNDAAAHWADISAAMAAFAAQGASGDVTATLVGAGACARAESFIAWLRYARSAELFDAVLQAKLDDGDDELDLFDAHTQTAARLAMSMAISQSWAENLLSQGLALRDRLPKVAECLRDGLITPAQARQIISRTELVDGTDHAAPVDAAIAVALRAKPGSWTVNGIRNLADRVVFRHHPDAVREARERSLANRTTWVTPAPSGMATVGASMTAENARLAHRRRHRAGRHRLRARHPQRHRPQQRCLLQPARRGSLHLRLRARGLRRRDSRCRTARLRRQRPHRRPRGVRRIHRSRQQRAPRVPGRPRHHQPKPRPRHHRPPRQSRPAARPAGG
ncbi:hypothetical protein GOARA_056_01160 [Gordonia araii NBRC 100433]|uniref:DUF222 domain-containing protein n=1 Tax=Gordonia araii NBRC 100433 TaxID=1073574 RepID=G7H3E3_9ACTN|nr:DUF222 domain-containing protein [Gordonia araii NBRC 100433]GAB10368.1 hypothetical protein GOARA_056_01160 [Gordonia araii NBRC 100433]